MAAGTAVQAALYEAVRHDPVLAAKIVIELSLGGGSLAQYMALGDHGRMADAANAHIYFEGGQPVDRWNELIALARAPTPNKPVYVTETGAADARAPPAGSNAPTQARQILNALMDAASTGVAGTCVTNSSTNAPSPPARTSRSISNSPARTSPRNRPPSDCATCFKS